MKKEYISKYYNELGVQIQSEVSKSSQILGFLGILVFVGLSKVSSYDNIYKIFVFILLILDIALLLYSILGKGQLGHPSISDIQKVLSMKEMENNYKIGLRIFNEKHQLNKITTVLTILLFILIIYIIFFVG